MDSGIHMLKAFALAAARQVGVDRAPGLMRDEIARHMKLMGVIRIDYRGRHILRFRREVGVSPTACRTAA